MDSGDIGLGNALTQEKGIGEKAKAKGRNNGDTKRVSRKDLVNKHGVARDLGKMQGKDPVRMARGRGKDTRDLVGPVAKLAISQMSALGSARWLGKKRRPNKLIVWM